MCGTTACSMNGEAALIRRRPAGVCWRRARRSSSDSICSRMCRAFSRKNAPSSVSCTRRVVRLSRVVASFSSSFDRVRLTAEAVRPSWSAAEVMEPQSMTVTKVRSSSEVAFICCAC
ncbi:hypothetical protein D9M73_264400 [compost metagenome]